MKYDVIILTSAYNDLEDAVGYYESKVIGLGKKMEADFWDCLEFIHRRPLTNRKKHKLYRQSMLRKFPYAIVYQVLEEEIIVYRVPHLKMQSKKRYKI